MKSGDCGFGPWTTTLSDVSHLALSRFWTRRLHQLPWLTHAVPRVSGLTRAWMAPLAISLALAPLVELTSHRLTAEEPSAAEGSADETRGDAPAVDQGSPLLRRLREAGAPLLQTMTESHGYALTAEEAVHRVSPPFPAVRMEWYRIAHPSQADAIPRGPDGMIFQWQEGALRNDGMTFGAYSIEGLLTSLAGIYPQDLEGPKELRRVDVPGDWIVRVDAPPKLIVRQLERILNHELSLGIRLHWRTVDREAYVMRGKYKFTPLAGQPDVDETQLTDRVSRTDPIQVFGDRLVPNSGAGGGMGPFPEFCAWVGRWVSFPIVNEADELPQNDVSWSLHQQSPFTEDDARRAHDAEVVLRNITRQTGLTFAKETRPLQILFIEKADEQADNANHETPEESP